MSYTYKLYRLQQIDSQIDQTHMRLNAINTKLNDDASLRQAQAQVDAIKLKVNETRKVLRHAEEEVHAQEYKIEQTEATLYGGKVNNPKELQDLQKEASALKKFLIVLEDRQLEIMLVMEDLETEYKTTLANLEVVQNRVAKENGTLSKEQSLLLKDIERMEIERRVAAVVIPAPDLDLYEQLRQQRRGMAVAIISENSCSACGSNLTPAVVQTASSSDQIIRCGFCGRILFAG